MPTKKIEELNEPKKRKSNVLKFLLGGIILVFAIAFAYFKIMTKEPDLTTVKTSDPAQRTSQVRNTGTSTDSRAYKKATEEEDIRLAKEASERGTSSMPRLVSERPNPLEALPRKEPEPAPVPQPVQPVVQTPPPMQYSYQPPQNNGPGGLDRWMAQVDFQPGKLDVRKVERSEAAGKMKPIDEMIHDTGQGGKAEIAAGTMLYAVMDVGANSDQAGTPVMARVLSGEFAGAVFIGGFQRMDEKLVLQFNKMVWDDPDRKKNRDGKKQTYSVTGYAIDPDKFTPGVASDVNTHFWERWGGLAVASFLEGFGEAKSRSGTTYYYGNDNNPGQFQNNYNLSDEAWIAGGKIGQRMATQIEGNFNRPPTVSIHPGTPIGILVL